MYLGLVSARFQLEWIKILLRGGGEVCACVCGVCMCVAVYVCAVSWVGGGGRCHASEKRCENKRLSAGLTLNVRVTAPMPQPAITRTLP